MAGSSAAGSFLQETTSAVMDWGSNLGDGAVLAVLINLRLIFLFFFLVGMKGRPSIQLLVVVVVVREGP